MNWEGSNASLQVQLEQHGKVEENVDFGVLLVSQLGISRESCEIPSGAKCNSGNHVDAKVPDDVRTVAVKRCSHMAVGSR